MWDVVFLALGIVLGLWLSSFLKKPVAKPQPREVTLLPPSTITDETEGCRMSTLSYRKGKFTQSALNRVRRLPTRGNYERKEVYDILDSQLLCSVGLVDEVEGKVEFGQTTTDKKAIPVVIPMLFGRKGDSLYLHGHVSCGLHQKLKEGKLVMYLMLSVVKVLIVVLQSLLWMGSFTRILFSTLP